MEIPKNRKKIKNIGIAGGGFYGYAEVAVLKELENYKEYLDIKNVAGVSVGSIVAALYAVGYNADELTKILFDLDFDKLIKDTMIPYIKLYEKYGMYEASKLEDEIERLIAIKTNIKFCTFSQVEKNLIIIATNLNYQCPVIFSKEYTPDLPISKAIGMSICYPLVMVPKKYNGDFIGDGGEFINYPITLFDDLDQTLGITFASFNENNDGTLKNRIDIKDISDYIKAIGTTMSRAAYISQIGPKHLERSIVVHITENINSMQFNLTKEQKTFIYNCGVIAARERIFEILGAEPCVPVAGLVPNIPPQVGMQNKYLANVESKLPEVMDAVKQILSTHPEILQNIQIIKQ